MRLFFALWPPAGTAQTLSQWAHQVHKDTGGSHTALEKIHLTLAFLGEADPARAHDAAVRVQAARHALPIDSAQYWKHNRIVWAGPAAMPVPLRDLVNQLQAALRGQGFVLEDRPFAAHITLIRKAKMPQSLPPLPALEWPVDELALVRSRISARGSTYELVERFALA